MKISRNGSIAIALGAVVLVVAVITPAIGGQGATTAVKAKALKQLVRKEVARQIGKATGPSGANGLNGTARAYATVIPHAADSCAGGCTFDHAKGISGVTHPATGAYCVSAPGIDPAAVPAVATVSSTSPSQGVAVLPGGPQCPGAWEVDTANAGPPDDAVGFTIVIP